MNSIFIVLGGIDYEGTKFLGAFGCVEDAFNYATKKKLEDEYDYYQVIEGEIGNPKLIKVRNTLDNK